MVRWILVSIAVRLSIGQSEHKMVHGSVRAWLRIEGPGARGGSRLYAHAQRGWLLFSLLFLLPDASFLGYLAGPRTGAVVYNFAHSYVSPLALSLGALLFGSRASRPLHSSGSPTFGFDRTLGYGLKYPSAFRDTPLGSIGRAERESPASPQG